MRITACENRHAARRHRFRAEQAISIGCQRYSLCFPRELLLRGAARVQAGSDDAVAAQMTMKPVIIVYAKAPVTGQVKTRLIPRLGETGATKLHEAFVEDTLTMVSTLAESFDIELHTDVPANVWSWLGVRRVQCEGEP